jgi:hypothetical protein
MKPHLLRLAFLLLVWSLFPHLSEGAGNDNPTGVTGDYNGSITTAGSYDPYTGNSKRFIEDITVPGSVGAYPLKWTRVLNTRNGQISAPFGQGGTWGHSYQWGLWVRPYRDYNYYPEGYEGIDGSVYYPDGRTMDLKTDISGEYWPAHEGENQDRLQNVTGGFDLLLGDGGKVKFRYLANSTTNLIATEIVDPYGQTTLLGRDSAGRLSTITEPGGRYLQIHYHTYTYTVTYPAPGQNRFVDVIWSVEAFAAPRPAYRDGELQLHPRIR